MIKRVLQINSELTVALSKMPKAPAALNLENAVEKILFPYENRTIPRLAALLDPRMKKEGFRSTENADLVVSLLRSEMYHHTDTIIQNNNVDHEDKTIESVSTSISLFSFMTERIEEKKWSQTVTVQSIITLRQYLECPYSNCDTDPLMYCTVTI